MRTSGPTKRLLSPAPATVSSLSAPKLEPAAVQDTSELDLSPSTSSPLPKSPTSPPGFLTRLVGTAGRKALLTGAVAAAILGASLGPLSSPNQSPQVGAPITQVETQVAPAGLEVFKLTQGLGKVSELLAPLGLSHEELRGSLISVSASIELPAGHFRQLDDEVSIEAPAGSRLYASVSDHGVSLSLSPGLSRVVDWGIDSRIERVSYRFGDGSFHAEASGIGPDRLHSDAVSKAVEGRLGPLLPPAMREPGYSPRDDANLDANFQTVFDILRPKKGAQAGEGTELASPRMALVLQVPQALEVPLSEGAYVARIAKGTRIDVSFMLEGSVADPKLSSLQVRFSDPVEISAGAERALLKRLDLNAVTIAPGGQITADYSLGAEGVVDGLRALVAVTATIAEPRLAASTANMRPTRLEGARKDVSELIDVHVEPALRSLIQSLDLGIGGLSLQKVFGVESPPAQAPDRS